MADPYRHRFLFHDLPRLQADTFGSPMARVAYRRRWHARVAESVMVERARPPQPLVLARVVCTRHSTRRPDRGNLANSFKPILDGFVRARVLEDDKPEVLVAETYSWEKAPRGEGFVSIEIEEVSCDS